MTGLSLLQFCQQKLICLFCQKPLKYKIVNFLFHAGFDLLSCHLKNKKFHLTFKSDINPTSYATVCLLSNKLIPQPNSIPELLINQIDSLSPHLDAYCSNKKCKNTLPYHYSVSSSIIKFCPITLLAQPITLTSKSFHFNNLYVCHDLINHKIHIINKNNSSPIVAKAPPDFLDHNPIYKIQTLINLS